MTAVHLVWLGLELWDKWVRVDSMLSLERWASGGSKDAAAILMHWILMLHELIRHVLDPVEDELTLGVIRIDQVLYSLRVHAQVLHHVDEHVLVDAILLHSWTATHHRIEKRCCSHRVSSHTTVI